MLVASSSHGAAHHNCQVPGGIRDICHTKDRPELLRNEKEATSMLIIIIIMIIRHLILTFIYT